MKLDASQLESLIAQCLESFYGHRLQKIRALRLRQILSRKNPYLFRALATEEANEIVKQILSAYLSSSDETLFGNDFFEPIAMRASNGKVSEAAGVDFCIETSDSYTAYSMKSGPNALNASALRKLQDEFNELRRRLLKIHKQFDPVLAAGYGRKNVDLTEKRTYRIRCGQRFWTEITGDSDFYLKLIRLMKEIPRRHKEKYQPEWDAAVNRLQLEFASDFCFDNGHIDWEKLVRFVSSAEKSPVRKIPGTGKRTLAHPK